MVMVICTRLSIAILPLTLFVATAGAALPQSVAPRDGVLDQELAVVWLQTVPEDCLLGQVTDVARDDDGTLYLVDYKFADVKVFDGQGRFRRVLSRQGEGPGETEAPTDLVLRDGRLGIMQRWPARLIWLDPATGDPAGAVQLADRDGKPLDVVAFLGVAASADGLVAALNFPFYDETRSGSTSQIARLGAGDRVTTIYHQSEDVRRHDEPKPYDECEEYRFLEGCWTVAPDGRVFLAPQRDRHLIEARSRDGAVLWTRERAYTAPVRDRMGRDRAEKGLRAHGWKADNSEVCDRPPVVAALHWGDRNEIWVQLNLGGAGPVPGTIAWYDVLAGDGTYLRQVRWRGDFAPERDRRFRLDDRTVLVVRSDDDGAQTLRLLAAPPGAH